MLLLSMCVITPLPFPLRDPASSLLSIPLASHRAVCHFSSCLPKFCSSQTLLDSLRYRYSQRPLASLPFSLGQPLTHFHLPSPPFLGAVLGPRVLQVLSSSGGLADCSRTEKGGAWSLAQTFSLCPLRTS